MIQLGRRRRSGFKKKKKKKRGEERKRERNEPRSLRSEKFQGEDSQAWTERTLAMHRRDAFLRFDQRFDVFSTYFDASFFPKDSQTGLFPAVRVAAKRHKLSRPSSTLLNRVKPEYKAILTCSINGCLRTFVQRNISTFNSL